MMQESVWKRDQGYYNAWQHERPLTLEEFDEKLRGSGLTDAQVSKRYELYVGAWEARRQNSKGKR